MVCSPPRRLVRGEFTPDIAQVECPKCRTWWERNKRPIEPGQTWEHVSGHGERGTKHKGVVVAKDGAMVELEVNGRRRQVSGFTLRKDWRPAG